MSTSSKNNLHAGKTSFASMIILLMMLACDPANDEITTFILVRHAEKGNDGSEDPDLTDEGTARARRLAVMFQDTPIAAIYSTNYRRTKNTARPLAAAHNLDVQTLETFKRETVEELIHKHRGEIILIAGHSDTTPWTANALTESQRYKKYAETEYGIILIVSVTKRGRASVVRVNY